MSVQALSFAAMMWSGKTMVEGISEGNLTKAVIGGVGMYAGLSGMESLGTEASKAAAAQEAGAAAGEASTTAATQELGTTAAAETGAGAAGEGLGTAAANEATKSAVTEGVAEGAAGDLGTNAAGEAVAGEAAEEGFLGKVGGWFEKNPKMGYGLMQMGGGMIQGSANEELQRDLLNKKWNREERLMDESRQRRGYVAGKSLLDKHRYNPRTGQWEEKA